MAACLVTMVTKHTIVFAAVVVVIVTANDPCTDYADLGNPRRSTAHALTDWETPVCDMYTVVPGNWYRFEQYNGEMLAEECTGSNKCGTQATIWMNGSHPTNYAEADAKVCLSANNNCCFMEKSIKVRRCPGQDGGQDYFVYQLAKFEGCSAAYCAGSFPPCPRHSIYNYTMKSCACYKPDICPLDPENEPPVLFAHDAIVQLPGERGTLEVKGYRFYNLTPTCKMTYFKTENGVTTEGASQSSGINIFRDYYTAHCPLPVLPGSCEGGACVHGWRVTLSNNGGRTFSNQIEVNVIDSVCHTCDAQNTCTIKGGYCFIGGQCFTFGGINPGRACLSCTPPVSTNLWTSTTDTCHLGCSIYSACDTSGYNPRTPTTTPVMTSSVTQSTVTPAKSTVPTSHSSAGTTSGDVTTLPPWGPWSACSKPECDYGYRERTRTSAGWTDSQRELCSKVNCEESPGDKEKGVIFLIQTKPDEDATLLQVVVHEHVIMSILMNEVNNVCVNDMAACCPSGKSKDFTGRTSIVTSEDTKIASGFPRKYQQLDEISGLLHSRIKVMTFINPEVENLICHLADMRRQKREAPSVSHVPRDVLKQAVENSLENIKTSTGLHIKGYLLPDDSTEPWKPAKPPLELIVPVIVVIVICVTAMIIGVICFMNKKKDRQVDSNEQPAVKYVADASTLGQQQKGGRRLYDKDPTQRPNQGQIPAQIYYDDSVTPPPGYSPANPQGESQYDVIKNRISQASYYTIKDSALDDGYSSFSSAQIDAHPYAKMPAIQKT